MIKDVKILAPNYIFIYVLVRLWVLQGQMERVSCMVALWNPKELNRLLHLVVG